MVVVKFLLISILVLVAWAAPPPAKEPVPIVSQESDVDYSGKYFYKYESADGSKAEQSGELKQFDKDNAGEVVQGSFEYVGEDGKTYKLNYIADENGYQPQGDHLPVAPEIPPMIARALAYLATAPPPKEGRN